MGQGKFYMIDPGVYVRGGDTAGRVASPDYVGLQFVGTPTRQFGWILFSMESQLEPGSTESILGTTEYITSLEVPPLVFTVTCALPDTPSGTLQTIFPSLQES